MSPASGVVREGYLVALEVDQQVSDVPAQLVNACDVAHAAALRPAAQGGEPAPALGIASDMGALLVQNGRTPWKSGAVAGPGAPPKGRVGPGASAPSLGFPPAIAPGAAGGRSPSPCKPRRARSGWAAP